MSLEARFLLLVWLWLLAGGGTSSGAVEKPWIQTRFWREAPWWTEIWLLTRQRLTGAESR